ncbi:MAG TPA: hypothetical protein PLM09_10070 [Casimicrobiaceae bacterium]|nr:hypothetical protein [Casimicrobiaceae bacterium]
MVPSTGADASTGRPEGAHRPCVHAAPGELDDRFRAGVDVQRPQDRGDVDLDGALGQAEVAADALVGQPLEQQAQDVGLALREADGETFRPRARWLRARIRRARHRPSAPQRGFHRGDHLGRVRVLGDVAAGSGGERAVDRCAVVRRGQHDDRQARVIAAQLDEIGESSRSRQREVEEERVAVRVRGE